MDISRSEITEYAGSLGFDDTRFAHADGALRTTDGSDTVLRDLLPDATSLLVLFKQYHPASAPPPDHIAMSAYYIASHAAYTAAKALTAHLVSHGAQALAVPMVNAKQAALRTCGFIGDNGLFFHPQYGSLVTIQTILTDAAEPLPRADGPSACPHCGACAATCPSGGVGDTGNCLRKHYGHIVPIHLRGDIYQLIGCERCQISCPLNSTKTSPAVAYPIADLLAGKHTKELKALAGSNFVRQRRMISQSVLYAAATGAHQHLGRIRELAQNADEPVRTHARWAMGVLTKGTCDED